MALLPIFLDAVSRRFVFSETQPRATVIPDQFQEDAVTIEFTLLKRIRDVGMPYFEKISLAGSSLKISIGDPTVPIAYAQQSVWTLNADNTKFSGTLNLNTSGIAGLAQGALVYFEAVLTDGSGNPFTAQQRISIYRKIAVAGSLTPVTGDRAVGNIEVDRRYVKKDGLPGEGFILTSLNTGKKVYCFCHDDGTFQAQSIT